MSEVTDLSREVAALSAEDRSAALAHAHDLRKQASPVLASVERELTRRMCRESLRAFVMHFWDVLEEGTELQWNWHLDILCDIVESSVHRRGGHDVINVPPGTMKSLLMSVYARAWLWANNPALRFLTASYSAHLSVRDNRRLRDLITHPRYRAIFPDVKLTDDQNVKVKFETTKGGWSIATSVDGAGTGEHPDYIIIDDPLSAKQAESDADRDRANAWLDRTMSTRGVTRNVCVWLIMQRLHEKDPAAHLLSKGSYALTKFPMRYEEKDADPKDARTIEGSLLWPKMFDKQRVEKLEIDLGQYGCTPAESPVLMHDLSLKAISEIVAGDKVIGFHKRFREDGKGRLTLTQSAVQVVHKYNAAPVMRVVLETGAEIRCTADHKWFTRSRGSEDRDNYLPITVGRTKLARVCPSTLPTLSSEDERLAGWLSGFFDGEGTVSLCRKNLPGHYRSSVQIHFYQGAGRNLPLCEKLERALLQFGFDFHVSEDERKPNKDAPCYGYRVYTLRGHNLSLLQRFLHIVQPTKWRDRIITGALGAKFIQQRERVISAKVEGNEDVYALTTDTGNYVVWGFASSNSAGQLQQRPAPLGGGLFKLEWFSLIDTRPAEHTILRSVRGWDVASTEEAGDYTAGVRISELHNGRFVVEHVAHGQWSPATVDNQMLACAVLDGRKVLVREEKDPGSAGVSVITNRATRTLRGFDYVGVSISGSKVTRAGPFRAQCEARNVDVVIDAWTQAYLDELCAFPTGEHDDRVDGSSCAFNELIAAPIVSEAAPVEVGTGESYWR